MRLSSIRKSGHAPTLFCAFLHFDVSFMIWVILGALAPFLTTDPSLTGTNLRVVPLATVAKPYTLVVKSADRHTYRLLVKPGDPSVATKSSVKAVESYVLDDADPATLAHLNASSRLIRVTRSPDARGNPNENVVELPPAAELERQGRAFVPIANGFPASLKLTLIGIPLLAAGFWRILLGLLADRFGSKPVGICSLAVTLVPLLMGWLGGGSYSAWLLIGFFLGVAGASFAVALPLASRWYPPHLQGLVMGIAGAGNSGTVMATIFAPVLAKSYGWHTVFGLLTVPVGLTLVLFALLAKEPARSGQPTRLADFARVLSLRDTWAFCFLYFVTFGGFVGLSSFFNSFFVDQYDAPKAAVGLWTWPFIVAGSLVRPIGGALADRLGGIRMLSILFGVAAAASLAVAQAIGSFPVTALALFVLMACLGMGNGSVFQLVPQRFSREIGIVTGLVGAAGGIGGYYLNFALGHLHDATGAYTAGFWVLAAMGVLALLLLRAVAPAWTRSWLSSGGRAIGDERPDPQKPITPYDPQPGLKRVPVERLRDEPT